MHQDFIVDAAGSIGGEFRPLLVIKGGNRLDKPDGTDGNQILRVVGGGVVFLYDMGHQPQVALDKLRPGGGVSRFHPLETLLFLLLGERFWKAAAGRNVQRDKEQIPDNFQKEGQGQHSLITSLSR